MPIEGAGGTKGGIGRFFMGLAMMIAGGYLFLNAVQVTHHFNFGYIIQTFGPFQMTTGMVLVPLIFGIGIIFYNSGNWLGWILFAASLVMLVFSIISSIQFVMRSMTAFEFIMIIILLVGGIGLFLSSLRAID